MPVIEQVCAFSMFPGTYLMTPLKRGLFLYTIKHRSRQQHCCFLSSAAVREVILWRSSSLSTQQLEINTSINITAEFKCFTEMPALLIAIRRYTSGVPAGAERKKYCVSIDGADLFQSFKPCRE